MHGPSQQLKTAYTVPRAAKLINFAKLNERNKSVGNPNPRRSLGSSFYTVYTERDFYIYIYIDFWPISGQMKTHLSVSNGRLTKDKQIRLVKLETRPPSLFPPTPLPLSPHPPPSNGGVEGGSLIAYGHYCLLWIGVLSPQS